MGSNSQNRDGRGLMQSGYVAITIVGVGLVASFAPYAVVSISEHQIIIWVATIAVTSVIARWVWRQLFGKGFSFRDASLGHFAFVLLLSFIPVFYATTPVLVLINGLFDDSQAHAVTAQVRDKYKPSRHAPILVLESWRRGEAIEKVAVDAEVFDAVEKGTRVKLQTHGGAFEWEWVSDVQVLR